MIIVPRKDIAAMNIWETWKERSFFKASSEFFGSNRVYHFEQAPNDIKLVFSEKDGVATNHLEEELFADLFIFASRHSAASGVPALLIHSTGNWAETRLGGNPYELSYTSALAIKLGLMHLIEQKENNNLVEYKVGLEVTHHGPTELSTPMCFMELGSSEQNWKDRKGALAVGDAILETAREYIKRKQSFSGDTYIGFGGNHYAYRFQKQLEDQEEVFVGHMAAKYALDEVNKATIMQAFEKTIEKPKAAMVDKKGAKSEQRKKIKQIVEMIGKEYIEV